MYVCKYVGVWMRLTEIDQKCEEIESTRKQLEVKLAELQKLKSEAKEKNKEAQMLKEIAKLRGVGYEVGRELEDLEKARKAVEDYRKKIKKLEREVYKGLKDITFEIPLEIPKVGSEGKSIIKFEGEPCNYAVGFIASTLNSDIPLELDKTQIHPDKIVVTNVKDVAHVIERLKILRSNIGRLARIALQEKDPNVEEMADYLHESGGREIWEAIKGRKKISYTELFSDLALSESKDKKRVRNFFTNLKQLLKEKCPFMRVAPGVYELTFFGSLVWKRYNDKYPAESIMKEPLPQTVVETTVKKEEKKKAEMPSLNKYLSNNEIKEIIYGKEVS